MLKRQLPLLLLCLLLLSGCGAKEPPPAASPEAPPSQQTAPEAPPPQEAAPESPALAAFRGTVPADGIYLAAAYLGAPDLTGYEDLTVYLEANRFYDVYPFLSELTDSQFVQQPGSELYLIVPAAPDLRLTVFDCGLAETGTSLARGDELARLDAGEPVILQGNISELVPNLTVTAESTDGETVEYAPSLSMMDGSLALSPGVYDCTDYGFLLTLWSGPVEEVPIFCGTWYTQATDADGLTRTLKLTLWYDGLAEYSYGIPESDILESFEGRWQEADGILTLELHGGPLTAEGTFDFTYDTVCSFAWDYQSRHLWLRHTDGGVLLHGTEGMTFQFLPFDAWRLEGTWSADAIYRDWTYTLSLLENGECHFRISEFGEELALYEGWWFMSENAYVSLDLGLSSGQHPENPEMEHIIGTYLAEKYGNSMDFSFASGGILTLNMEENGYETFTRAPEGSCVSAYYAQDVAADWSECDWVIVDDTDPAIEAAFCTMVPVEDFTVVSLLLQDVTSDGTPLHFDVTELYNYGTLTPERPLRVTLTVYGTIPTYGVSFRDPNGIYRLFGVTISGMDGSLELTELP